MLTKLKTWFSALSLAGKIGVVGGLSLLGLAAASPAPQKPPAPACNAAISYNTENQTIAYKSTSVDDGTLAKGQTKVTTAGINGQKEIKHKITTYMPHGCKADADVIVSENITKQPVDQVTAVGTYVAPAPTPQAAPTPSTSSPATPPASCYPLTNGGNCYEPGEYCRNSDHGASGVAGDGENIVCADNNGWRWEPS